VIRVIVQLVPHGMEDQTVELARMHIANETYNDHEHWPDESDYSVQVVTDQGEDISARQRMIRNFPRLKLNVWALILSALGTFTDEDYELRFPTQFGAKQREARWRRLSERNGEDL